MSDPHSPEVEPPELEPTGRFPPERPGPEPQTFLLAAPRIPPEKSPFWGYYDLLLFISVAPVCLFLGYGLVSLPLRLLHIHPAARAMEELPEQLAGYLLLFGALAVFFKVTYGRPFWASLGWAYTHFAPAFIAFAGVFTALCVVVAGYFIHLPDTPNQLTELMQTRTAVLLMAIFGITVAPVCEELAFRGFLQPLLVRSLGAAPGILLAALPFGLLHYSEYGNSWPHVLLISAVGAALGTMRQVSGSTKASALMHASYNAFFFLIMLTQPRDLPQSW